MNHVDILEEYLRDRGIDTERFRPLLNRVINGAWDDGWWRGYKSGLEEMRDSADEKIRKTGKKIHGDDMALGVTIGTKDTQHDRKQCCGSQEQPYIPGMTRGKPRPEKMEYPYVR